MAHGPESVNATLAPPPLSTYMTANLSKGSPQ